MVKYLNAVYLKCQSLSPSPDKYFVRMISKQVIVASG